MARITPLPGVRTGLIDLVITLLFAFIGKASHHEAITIAGLAATWWPFAIGAAAGWLVSYALRIPISSIAGGLVTAVAAVGVGMLLRVVSGQGVQVSFVVVATIILVVALVGWRVIATVLVRRRPKPPTAA